MPDARPTTADAVRVLQAQIRTEAGRRLHGGPAEREAAEHRERAFCLALRIVEAWRREHKGAPDADLFTD